MQNTYLDITVGSFINPSPLQKKVLGVLVLNFQTSDVFFIE